MVTNDFDTDDDDDNYIFLYRIQQTCYRQFSQLPRETYSDIDEIPIELW
jgi:hypothetical protein